MENKETFYLDEDGQSILCHIITTMFSEEEKNITSFMKLKIMKMKSMFQVIILPMKMENY